jgi:hypothetical protein
VQSKTDPVISRFLNSNYCGQLVPTNPEIPDVPMYDSTIIESINRLAREEHELFERESRGTATDDDRERHQVMLDQCWDLLRQRRARREFGFNPDEARVRDEKTVEGYTG